MPQIIKEVKHGLVLSPDDVRALMPVLGTGIKNSPSKGFDVRKATPVIEKMNEFLRTYGSERYESE